MSSTPETPETEGDEAVASTSAWRRVYLMARPRATRANAFALLLACLLGFAIATQVRQTQSQGLEDLRQDELTLPSAVNVSTREAQVVPPGAALPRVTPLDKENS